MCVMKSLKKILCRFLILVVIDLILITPYYFPLRNPIDGLTTFFFICLFCAVMLITSVILIVAKKADWGYAFLMNVITFWVIASLESHLHTYIYYGFWSY